MGFSAGIIGLPNVGKTTIFNALTALNAEASAYPFCTIEPNIALVSMVDHRLERLVELVQPPQWAAATVLFTDVAGLVRGASKGEGLGNQFLGHIRTVDTLVHVIRCFDNAKVAHMYGSVDPLSDIEIVNVELLLADLESLERRMIKVQKSLRGGDKRMLDVIKVLERIQMALEQGHPARTVPRFSLEEEAVFSDFDLVTARTVVYCANVDEHDIRGENPRVDAVRQRAAEEKAAFVVISGDLEAALATMEGEERELFLAEYEITESGLQRLMNSVIMQLGLVTFYTIVGKEVRSWLIPTGTLAPVAAGKIHGDMQRGFIKAEVLSYDDFITSESWSKARESGIIRQEGKNYPIQDGDVVHFRFNV